MCVSSLPLFYVFFFLISTKITSFISQKQIKKEKPYLMVELFYGTYGKKEKKGFLL